jgi:hypothetical protein
MWKNDGSEGIAWFVRGIKPDASFYGELRFDSPSPSKRKATFVDGNISKEDWPRVQELLSLFNTPVPEPKLCFASISKWDGTSLSNAQITFQYNLGDELKSDEAQHFLELHELLEKELSKSYGKIT